MTETTLIERLEALASEVERQADVEERVGGDASAGRKMVIDLREAAGLLDEAETLARLVTEDNGPESGRAADLEKRFWKANPEPVLAHD